MIFLITFNFSANAQTSFICVPSNAVGFTFNTSSQIWSGGVMNVGDKKSLLKKKNNNWVWSNFGESIETTCSDPNLDGSVVMCSSFFGDVIFNRNTKRYIETYVIGYTAGNGNDTPYMVIGTCTSF